MSTALGFVAAGVAVFCFGSNFLPVKKFDSGDGVFFQWVMCTAIWIFGLIVHLAQGWPEFQPWALLGGVFWCTGNMMTVPTIQCIGLGLGLCIWGSTSLLMGWASGKFGLFGLTPQTVATPWLNWVGVGFCVVSVIVFTLVRAELAPSVSRRTDEDMQGLVNSRAGDKDAYRNLESEQYGSDAGAPQRASTWVDRLTPVQKRIAGALMSFFAGLMYGINFDPPQYLIDHGGDPVSMHYVFSHFSGIFLTSTFYMLVYAGVKKNKPKVYPEIILPGFVSGIFWAIAQTCWFYANANLQFVITFPVISTGPGLVGALWGIFLFKEIRGRKNFLLLGLAFSLMFVGVAMTVMSKCIGPGASC